MQINTQQMVTASTPVIRNRPPVLRLLRAAGFLSAVLALLCVSAPLKADGNDASLWKALKSGGHVVLMRHALAPGTGDPEDFVLDRCDTQRNLSSDGRAQAKRIGDRIRLTAPAGLRVYSSQWCRCLETAELIGLGAVGELPALNSFFRQAEREPEQTRALTEWIAAQDMDHTLVMVTHQVNITALTGVYPRSGEMVILRRSAAGGLDVTGTIRTD